MLLTMLDPDFNPDSDLLDMIVFLLIVFPFVIILTISNFTAY